MQAAGGVDDHDGARTRHRRAHAVEDDRRRVATLLLPDQLGARPLRPDVELLDGGGAEGIAGDEQHLLSRRGVTRRELPDRRRLADAVHPDDHDHVRRRERARRGRRQRRQHRRREPVADRLLVRLATHGIEELRRRPDADVGADERRLQLLDGRGIERASAEDAGDAGEDAVARLGETASPAVERGLLWRRCGTSRRRRDRRRPPSPARAPDRERDADQHEDDESGGDPKGGCSGEIERPRKAVHRAP